MNGENMTDISFFNSLGSKSGRNVVYNAPAFLTDLFGKGSHNPALTNDTTILANAPSSEPVTTHTASKKKMPLLAKLLLGTAIASGINHSPQALEGIKAGWTQHKAEATRSVTGREAQESLPNFFKTDPEELRGIKQLVNDQPDDVVLAMLNYVSKPTQDAYRVISTMVQGVPGRSDLWEIVKKNPDAAKDVLQYSMQERYLTKGAPSGWRAPALNPYGMQN